MIVRMNILNRVFNPDFIRFILYIKYALRFVFVSNITISQILFIVE